MAHMPAEEGLAVVSDQTPPDFEHLHADRPFDLVSSGLRDAFIDTFNGRDLEALLALMIDDVDCPDAPGDGVGALAEQLEAIWERSPAAVLTPAVLDDQPCAVAWLPDEDGCWSRAALVCFDAADGQLTLVAVPDDADALERAEAAGPVGAELEEWLDWAEWEHGEETVARPRDRSRP